ALALPPRRTFNRVLMATSTSSPLPRDRSTGSAANLKAKTNQHRNRYDKTQLRESFAPPRHPSRPAFLAGPGKLHSEWKLRVGRCAVDHAGSGRQGGIKPLAVRPVQPGEWRSRASSAGRE